MTPAPDGRPQPPHAGSRVFVLATTVDGTPAALVAAKSQASGAHVLLLVPRRTVGFRDVETAYSAYRELAGNAGVPVTVRICRRRRVDHILHLLGGQSPAVFIGEARHPWWPTSTKRLARRLRQQGYRVVVAKVNGARASDQRSTA